MKQIELTISERVFALGYLDAFKGTVSLLAKVLDSVKGFAITTEDWEKAGREVSGDKNNVQWSWSDEKGGLKEIEADEDVLSFLKIEIDKKDKSEGFGLKDKAVITLRSKIEEALK